ncbi:MAG TPA: DUF6152 family protein [Candidatus Acidoferrales bacterium]|nr:DUF6152 family protein [Candidatus Acidoferrales bacterium]
MQMRMKALFVVAVFVGVLGTGSVVFAHHGDAAYVNTATVLKDAVVTEYDWMNPHSLIKVDAKDENGKVQHWTMEIGSTPSMMLHGWSRTTLKAGDVITVYIYQAKTGLTVGRLNKLVLPDGTVLTDRDAATPSRYGQEKPEKE